MKRRCPTVSLAALPLAAAVSLALLSAPAQARSRAAEADLKVEFDAPASVAVSQPAPYAITVTNRGRQTSGTITLRVSLPLTDTSPQVYLLGQVDLADARCSLQARELVCQLSPLRRGASTVVGYDYTAPVASKPLTMTATVSSSVADPVPGNNTDAVVPNVQYPALPVTAAAIDVRMCTGQGLTSFESCTHFPSAINTLSASLLANQTVDFGMPGYSGTWQQNAARNNLAIDLFENQGSGPVKIGAFSGWAVNGRNCFEGLSTNLSNPAYVSAWEVCLR